MPSTVSLRFLPSSLLLLMGATVASVYILATAVLHDEGLLPTISETADDAPQSCLFSFGVSLSSALMAGVVYLRKKQMEARLSALAALEVAYRFAGVSPAALVGEARLSLQDNSHAVDSFETASGASGASAEDVEEQQRRMEHLRRLRTVSHKGAHDGTSQNVRHQVHSALRWNEVSWYTGAFAALCLNTVGSFQSAKVPEVHYPAAILFFLVGNVFMFCTAVVSYKQRSLAVFVGEMDTTEPLWLIRARLLAALMGFLSLLGAVSFGLVYLKARSEPGGVWGTRSWQYWWRWAALMEYSMVFCFCGFFLPLHREFRRLNVQVLVQDELVAEVVEPRIDSTSGEVVGSSVTAVPVQTYALRASMNERSPLL